MKSKQYHNTLEESVLLLLKRAETTPLSIGEILNILSGKGRSLILIFLSLPFCQPIQIPGFSTPFGLVIALIGIRIAFGKRIWLPKWLLSKQIASATIKKIAKKTLWLMKKARRWIHPRLDWICHHPIMVIFNGLLVGMLGVFLALPIPIPFSNLSFAWAIFFIGLGILEDDGLFIFFGYLMSLVSLVIFILIVMQIKWFF